MKHQLRNYLDRELISLSDYAIISTYLDGGELDINWTLESVGSVHYFSYRPRGLTERLIILHDEKGTV